MFEITEKRLAKLIDAYKHGRCIISPVAVGDTVYVLYKGDVVPMTVRYFYIACKPNRIYASNGAKHFNFRACDIGVTVFMSEDEARNKSRV